MLYQTSYKYWISGKPINSIVLSGAVCGNIMKTFKDNKCSLYTSETRAKTLHSHEEEHQLTYVGMLRTCQFKRWDNNVTHEI